METIAYYVQSELSRLPSENSTTQKRQNSVHRLREGTSTDIHRIPYLPGPEVTYGRIQFIRRRCPKTVQQAHKRALHRLWPLEGLWSWKKCFVHAPENATTFTSHYLRDVSTCSIDLFSLVLLLRPRNGSTEQLEGYGFLNLSRL